MTGPSTAVVRHWYDFICPFCYVAQDRNVVLRWSGISVEELAFPIHPDIGPGGVEAPRRDGPMYDFLRREADQAGLALVWSDRIAYSRPALQRSETVRLRRPGQHAEFSRVVFDAYFGQGLNIESTMVLDDCSREAGVGDLFDDAWSTDDADLLVDAAAREGVAVGVTGTPAWLVASRLIVGLRPHAEFEKLAQSLTFGWQPDANEKTE